MIAENDEFQFPDEDQARDQQLESESAQNANYVAYNNVPMGVTHYKDRLFVTVPRRRPGIPATLNTISSKSTAHTSPSYRAYPNYRTNELGSNLDADPNRLVSVYRTRIDACNRLWFIDTGMLEYPSEMLYILLLIKGRLIKSILYFFKDDRRQVQRPTIWVMDPETDTVIRKFPIPTSIVEMGNGLPSITVDVDPSNCDAAFAYVPDLAQYRLYTYE